MGGGGESWTDSDLDPQPDQAPAGMGSQTCRVITKKSSRVGKPSGQPAEETEVEDERAL